ncbi:MAG: hypothetical protein AVDCRST_MAG29-2143, partial [uncultured Nocardioidaceae bacterium]
CGWSRSTSVQRGGTWWSCSRTAGGTCADSTSVARRPVTGPCCASSRWLTPRSVCRRSGRSSSTRGTSRWARTSGRGGPTRSAPRPPTSTCRSRTSSSAAGPRSASTTTTRRVERSRPQGRPPPSYRWRAGSAAWPPTRSGPSSTGSGRSTRPSSTCSRWSGDRGTQTGRSSGRSRAPTCRWPTRRLGGVRSSMSRVPATAAGSSSCSTPAGQCWSRTGRGTSGGRRPSGRWSTTSRCDAISATWWSERDGCRSTPARLPPWVQPDRPWRSGCSAALRRPSAGSRSQGPTTARSARGHHRSCWGPSNLTSPGWASSV